MGYKWGGWRVENLFPREASLRESHWSLGMSSSIRPDGMHLPISVPAKMSKKAGPLPLQTSAHPWNQLTSQQSPMPKAQLSIHVTGRRAKSTGTVKILRGLPLAKCKYKNVTTYSSSTNFIILLRQAVKFFVWFYFFFFIYAHNVSHCILYVYR